MFVFLDSDETEYLLAMILPCWSGVDDAGELAIREEDEVLLGTVLAGLGAGWTAACPPSSCLPEAFDAGLVERHGVSGFGTVVTDVSHSFYAMNTFSPFIS